jgi:hypothetical protein
MRRDWPWPETEHQLVTSGRNFGSFDGFTFYVESKARILPERVRACVLAALEEGMVDDADFIVCSSGIGALLAFYLGIDRQRFRIRPTLAVFPAVDKPSISEMDLPENRYFWRLVGEERLSAVVLDNDAEDELAQGYLRSAHNFTHGRALYRMRWFQFNPDRWMPSEQHDGADVVWSGRWNRVKNPEGMSRILTLARANGLSAKAFTYACTRTSGVWATRAAKAGDFGLAIDLPPAEYVAEASRAKTLLMTSHSEAFPIGYMELMERGVVPVYLAQPWNLTHVGPDWPLRAQNEGEAVDMLAEAVGNHARLSVELRARLESRYAEPRNWGEIVRSVWTRYLSQGWENPWGKTWHAGRQRLA